VNDDRGLTGDRPDRSVDEEAERLAEVPDPVAPSLAPGGQAGSASGGYGSGSAVQSSGGTGEATDETSTPGDDAQTEWLRDAAAGGGER
jgi:hypothetical protein